MKLSLSDDTYGVETTERDLELARHVRDLADPARDIVSYFHGEAVKHCHRCNDKAPTRPLALQDDAGQPVMAHVCADCQVAFVEQRLEQAKRQMEAQAQEPEYECPECGNREALTVDYHADAVVSCPVCAYGQAEDADA